LGIAHSVVHAAVGNLEKIYNERKKERDERTNRMSFLSLLESI